LVGIYEKGFKHQLTDRVGKSLTSGGDNEIGYAIALSGYKIFFDNSLTFKHFIHQKRLTISYIKGLLKGQQLTLYKIRCYEKYLLKKKLNFPKSRFSNSTSIFVKIVKLIYRLLKREISILDFNIFFTAVFYKQLYQFCYFSKMKNEIENVEKNIKLILNEKTYKVILTQNNGE
jgi:hypothetical protein